MDQPASSGTRPEVDVMGAPFTPWRPKTLKRELVVIGMVVGIFVVVDIILVTGAHLLRSSIGPLTKWGWPSVVVSTAFVGTMTSAFYIGRPIVKRIQEIPYNAVSYESTQPRPRKDRPRPAGHGNEPHL